MPFPTEPTVTPTERGAVSIVFYIPDPTRTEENQYGTLEVQIYYSDGMLKARKFDLLARLQDDAEGRTCLENLAALKTYILNRISTELLNQ